jgi:predicted small lipoprotein YifL
VKQLSEWVHPALINRPHPPHISLRLDGGLGSLYGGLMKRILTSALLLAFAVPLSGCGITGDLKTPPPIWGEEVADKTQDDTTQTAETETVSDNPLDKPVDENVGYGVNVADQP